MARHLGRRIGQQACWSSPHRAVSAPPTYATHAAHGTTSPRGDEEIAIPVVDVSALADDRASSMDSRRRAGVELVAAASSVGLFYVTGHGVPEASLFEARARASQLFEVLDAAQKDALHVRHSPSGARGYQVGAVCTLITQGMVCVQPPLLNCRVLCPAASVWS